MSKRFISLCILAAIVLGFIGYVLWKKFDTGTVTIIEPAPFTFMFDTSDMVTCTSGTCTLTLSSGSHDVLIAKSGFVNFLAQVNIERGKNIELKPSLLKVLTVEARPLTTYTLPKIDNPFVLRVDADGKTSLVRKASNGSKKDEVIAYFARPFTSPNISTDKTGQYAWIADGKRSENDASEKSIYRVNVKEKSRKAVFSTTKSILSVIPSPIGSSALIILSDEVDVVNSDGNIVAKLLVGGQNEKTITWGGESILYIIQHGQTEDTLSRTLLDDGNGSVQMKKIEEISKWNSSVDTIQFVYVDEKLHELHIQGKKKAYAVKL